MPPILGVAAKTRPNVVADLFCGTGTVSAAFKRQGWTVHANDTLSLCTTLTRALLLNDGEPEFLGISTELEKVASTDFLGRLRPYDRALLFLNDLPPVEGFCWRSFSPATVGYEGVERRYFTEENAGRIDAIRARIEEWAPRLTPGEEALLLRDLVRASNAVSNIAGTYGCYLKSWKRRALNSLTLSRSELVEGDVDHRVSQTDAAQLAAQFKGPIAYADPPYTKRQYAAYYHVLETLVRNDKPPLKGKTGLRPWQADSSDWCYRRKAPSALNDLVEALDCREFFLSYNEDGQIPHEQVLAILSAYGEVREVHEVTYKRYKSSGLNHKGSALIERLYHLRKG